MPSWGVHLAVVKEVLNRVKIENKNDFIFGNVLPDVQNGYVIHGVSKVVSHKISHFDDFPKGVYGCHKRFYEIYGDSIYKDTMKLAYYTHLFTDDIWNREFYENKVCINDGKIEGFKLADGTIKKGTHESVRELKHSDFGTFSKYLISSNREITPEYDKSLIDKSNSIDIVDINENDLKKVFEYLNLQKAILKNIKIDDWEKKNINSKFKILSLEEAEEIFNKCVDEIVDELRRRK